MHSPLVKTTTVESGAHVTVELHSLPWFARAGDCKVAQCREYDDAGRSNCTPALQAPSARSAEGRASAAERVIL
jgi:hypothetical protein